MIIHCQRRGRIIIGDMVGAYAERDLIPRSFKLSNGVFTQLFPADQSPRGDAAFGINNSGQIVGQFSGGGGFQMEADGRLTQLQPQVGASQILP